MVAYVSISALEQLYSVKADLSQLARFFRRFDHLQAADPIPFSFHLTLPENTEPSKDLLPDADPRIPIHNSIHADLLLKHSSVVSTEDVFVIECEPEAVFKVREITRCSSSIDGESLELLLPHFSATS